MRVLLVHALPLNHNGGAEFSLKQHVEAAPPDVTVDTILPGDPVQLDRYDVVILASLRPAGRISSSPAGQLKQWLWKHMQRAPFQRFALRSELVWVRLWTRRIMGYRGYVIMSERGVQPCAHRIGRCLRTKPLHREPCGCTRSVTRAFEKLYNLCDAVQFLSPLHRQAINLLVRIDVPQYEIAPPLDLARFRNFTPFQERKAAALVTGDAIRQAPAAERRAREAGYQPEYLEYLSIPHENMPAVLNQCRAVVLEPVMLHAFGRLAAEAMACGCQVLANERVGALSWPDPVQACREANQRFWEMVRNVPARPNPKGFRGRSTGRAARHESPWQDFSCQSACDRERMI